MKRTVLAALAAFAVAGLALAGPGHSHDGAEAARRQARADGLLVVTPDELTKLIADGKVVVFDANGEATRTKFGTIPGAKMLASASDYALSELPAEKDKILVFYCGNARCTASDTAAKRAKQAGYDVAILRVGIAGWKDAGKETSAFSKS